MVCLKLISKMVRLIIGYDLSVINYYAKIEHSIYEINLKRKVYHKNQLKTMIVILKNRMRQDSCHRSVQVIRAAFWEKAWFYFL